MINRILVATLAFLGMQLIAKDLVDSLQVVQRACSGSEVINLGYSELGRPIVAYRSGSSEAEPLRVAIVAQQHGDEPGGMLGALQLMHSLCYKHHQQWSNLDILIVSQLNPDGAAWAQRRNAVDLDLNRHHIDLMPKELRALKRYLAIWQPHVVIDAHEYRPFKVEWSDEKVLRVWEMQLGGPSSLNTAPEIMQLANSSLIPEVLSRLSKLDIPCSEYYVGSPKKLRFSSTTCTSLRQSAAVQGAVAIILEGRRELIPTANLERRQWVQETTMACVLDWASSNLPQIKQACQIARTCHAGDVIYFREFWQRAEVPLKIQVAMCVDKSCDGIARYANWSVSQWFPNVSAQISSRLPQAYHIPKERADIVALLEEHGIAFARVCFERIYPHAESYKILGKNDQLMLPNMLPARSTTLQVGKREGPLKVLVGDYFVPVEQPQGKFAACILEPLSDSSLVWSQRFADLASEKNYPITRILK